MLLHAIAVRGRSADFPATMPAFAGHLDPLSQPLAALGLPQRSLNAMRAAGIATLADAADWSLRDLKTLPQVGPAALDMLQEALRAAHLDLRPSTRRRRL
jgi:DNA-directed RNA polymerase alpha subunit